MIKKSNSRQILSEAYESLAYVNKLPKLLVCVLFFAIPYIGLMQCAFAITECKKQDGEVCELNTVKLERLAIDGNAEAQFMLGRIYEKGVRAPINHEKSILFYSQAVKNQHLGAMYNLSIKYSRGEGIKEDIGKALSLMESAANLGSVEAQYALAVNIFKKKQSYQVTDKAFKQLVKSAMSGNSQAQLYLGKYYEFGRVRVGSKDYSKAIIWYQKSAKYQNLDAQFRLCRMYKKGFGVKKNIAVARGWCKKSAEKGHINSLLAMGVFEYEKKPKTSQTINQAIHWWRQASIQGDANAQYFLGVAYEKLGSIDKSKMYLNLAADAGHESAIKKLRSSIYKK